MFSILSKTKIIILTLSQTTNFRLFQTERVSDDNFKFDGNGRKFSKKVENTVGKGAISPFPTVFSGDMYCRHIKNQGLFGKGLSTLFFCLQMLSIWTSLKSSFGKELTLSQTSPGFNRSAGKVFRKHGGERRKCS